MSCTHTQHTPRAYHYKLDNNRSTSVPIVVGLSHINGRWELCDRGLFPEEKRGQRKEHSKPRKIKDDKLNTELG